MRSLAVLGLAILLLPTAAAFHQAPAASDEARRLDTDAFGDADRVTWRSVAFDPSAPSDAPVAYLVGGWALEEENRSRSLVARWTPSGGLEEVHNESGPPLTDIDVRADGTQVIVGLRDTILLGEPGEYRDVWDESRFADDTRDLTFYGLGAVFAPHADFAIVSGSSLLRVDADGSLEVVHSGEDAFFRTIDANPVSDYALVEAAVQQDRRPILGTIWRTNGFSNLTQEDNVEIYGRFERGDALLNAIAFAPNGTFATFAGRDGAGASFLTWSAHRDACHEHADGPECHDHAYRYMGAQKPTGPVTCIDWHPSGRYALVTGLEEDTLGFADSRMWAPLWHEGPDLLGCAFAPDGSTALAVGHNGTLVRVDPGEGPLVRVLDPKPGRLVPPEGKTRFLVGVLDRGERATTDVTGRLAGEQDAQNATPSGDWWTLTVNASRLEDGRHRLVVEAGGTDGAGGDEGSQGEHQAARTRFPFLVNSDAFQPGTPAIRSPSGLEATNRDSDGLFTVRWEPLDEPVVYQIEQTRRGEAANATNVIDAGSGDNRTVRVHEDGTYFFRVRAQNSHAVGNWTGRVSVEVVLDTDRDGVPDQRDPQPHTPNRWGDPDGDGVGTDVELKQCSDPYDADSTPTTDDDGDGIPNGIECEQGTDPRDPEDPPPDDGTDDTNDSTNDTSDDNGTNDSPGVGLPALAAAIAIGLAARTRQRPG